MLVPLTVSSIADNSETDLKVRSGFKGMPSLGAEHNAPVGSGFVLPQPPIDSTGEAV